MEGPVKKRGFPFRKKIAEPEPETPEQIAAREAAERLAAEQAARLEAIGEAWAQVSERVRVVLPSVSDPRQAYYLSLSRQGRESEEKERASLAAHCLGLIDKGLAALSAAREQERAASSTSSSSSSSSSSSGTSARASAETSALKALKSRWDAAARGRAAALLRRHGSRLAPSEREAYEASLEALSASPDKSAQPLRQKLIDRLMRANAYRRRAGRLAGWTASPAHESGPAGPYNDFAALEDTVRRVAASHPEWAAEFLDLYGEMNALRDAYRELLPKSKS